MAWQAKLTAVNVNLDKTVDALSFEVEFSETDGRKTSKTYILYLDDLADTNLLTLKARVDEDKARLAKLDEVKIKLEAYIDKVI